MDAPHPIVDACLEALVLDDDRPVGLTAEGGTVLLQQLHELKGQRALIEAVQELLFFAFYLEQHGKAPAGATAVLELLAQIEPLLHEIDSSLDAILDGTEQDPAAKLLAGKQSSKPVTADKSRLSVFGLRMEAQQKKPPDEP